MSLLGKVQAAVQKVQGNGDLNELRFRHMATWSDGTACRFSVQDPAKTKAGTELAQRLTGVPDVLGVRLLKVHPADPAPGALATLSWDGGTLHIEDWSQSSDFTGQAIGVCRFVR